MHRNTIRWVVIFAAFSIIGIIIIQLYWVNQAYSLGEKQFIHRVDLALNDVADNAIKFTNDTTLLVNPVQREASNYYHIEVNQPLELPVLEAMLIAAFQNHNVTTDFEYGVYDCIADTMLLGQYIRYDSSFVARPNRYATIPVEKREQSYIGVYFPKQERYLLNKMGFWIFSSAILGVVILFFAFTTFVILRQRRLSEITREFINNMTHEFKTPISTIGVSSEVLQRNNYIQSEERLLKYTQLIARENQRLKKQVEKVLQMATLEKHDFQLHKEEVNIHHIIEQAVSSVQLALDEKAGSISTRLQARQPNLEADKVHLTNIIYNLLDNAIKYSGDEPPEVLVHTTNTRQGVVITVEDKGIGIGVSDMKHIFRKFYRVSTGNRHDVKGFGLGLSYVKLMVEAHKGTIQVKSKPGIGSTFIIYLPYKS